jgi:hypothetical protein
MKEQDLIDLGFERTDDNSLQGRSLKQYEDSTKVFLIAAIGLFTIIAFSALHSLILV